jgi:hypothetical protein
MSEHLILLCPMLTSVSLFQRNVLISPILIVNLMSTPHSHAAVIYHCNVAVYIVPTSCAKQLGIVACWPSWKNTLLWEFVAFHSSPLYFVNVPNNVFLVHYLKCIFSFMCMGTSCTYILIMSFRVRTFVAAVTVD